MLSNTVEKLRGFQTLIGQGFESHSIQADSSNGVIIFPFILYI